MCLNKNLLIMHFFFSEKCQILAFPVSKRQELQCPRCDPEQISGYTAHRAGSHSQQNKKLPWAAESLTHVPDVLSLHSL